MDEPLEPAFGREAFGEEGAARIENYSSNRLYQNLTERGDHIYIYIYHFPLFSPHNNYFISSVRQDPLSS